MIKVFPVELGVPFLDFTGKMRRDGRVSASPLFDYARIANFYDEKGKIAGSLTYEVYDKAVVPDFKRARFAGPFFRKTGKQVILMHTVYVKPAYRGKGIMSALLDVMIWEQKPVYASFYNESLGEYFDRNFKR